VCDGLIFLYQAFELSDASAERSAAGCSIQLDEAPITEYLHSNVTLLKWMIAEGYGERRSIERRIASMENWLANPKLMVRILCLSSGTLSQLRIQFAHTLKLSLHLLNLAPERRIASMENWLANPKLMVRDMNVLLLSILWDIIPVCKHKLKLSLLILNLAPDRAAHRLDGELARKPETRGRGYERVLSCYPLGHDPSLHIQVAHTN